MLGKPVAEFSVPSAGGSNLRLADQRGKKLVPCFSPISSAIRHRESVPDPDFSKCVATSRRY
jgi:hypothetical protein